MALILADRVRDTTTTTGTGTVTLSGTAPTGYQNFSAIGNGNTTYYTINGGSEWEVGIGTYSSTGPTLARTTVLASSNSGSLVNFSAGTKDVFVTYPAEKSVNYDASNNVGIGIAPSTKLDVAGPIWSRSGGSVGAVAALFADASSGANGITLSASFVTGGYGPIKLDAGGSERMRVTSSGNVGIGDTAPAYKLTVAGDMRLTGGGDIRLSSATGTTTAGGDSMIYNDANNMIFTTGTTTAERMRIDSSGLVGVGTTAPQGKMEIRTASGGTVTNALTLSNYVGSTVNTGVALYFDPNGAGSVARAASIQSVQPTSGNFADLRFLTSNSDTPAERVRITPAGNVGIGTTNPTSLLDVNGNAEVNGTLFLGSSNHGNLASDSNTLYARGTNIAFQNAAGSGTYAYINSSGDLGIGTTSPGARLDVAGGSIRVANNQNLSFRNAAGTGVARYLLQNDDNFVVYNAVDAPIMSFGQGASPYTVYGANANNRMIVDAGSPNINWVVGGSERARIGSNGGVAIGGTGTDASLHIQQAYGGYNRLTQMAPSGTSNNAFNLMAAKNSGGSDNWWSWGVRTDSVWSLVPGVDSALTSSTGIYFDSTAQAYKPGGGSWQATSDARVKTNIAPITDAASRIMALRPSSFDYRAPEAHAGRVSDRGFIAQEFEEVYPHSVSSIGLMCDEEKVFFAEGEEMKTLGLNNDFFADLVALVQEQQETINDLRARVAQLEGN